MKTKNFFLIFLIVFCIGGIGVFAQDRVITKKGNVMEVYHVEISDKYIFFNREKSTDSTIERLAKDSVLMIRRQDGTVVNLSDVNKATSVAESDVQTVATKSQHEVIILTPDMLSDDARQANDVAIARINTPVMFEPDEPDDLKKEANCVWFRMGVKENSVLDDGTVSLELVGGNFRKKNNDDPLVFEESKVSYYPYKYNAGIQVAVSNKCDRTIYIDLAKCFFTRMGQPQCYYVPSATSVTSATGMGVGVNMGAVAGALGIGGVVGTLASGVNVGGSGSNETTTVTYTQRILTVPPHTIVKLEPQYLFGLMNSVELIAPGLSYGLFRGYKYSRKVCFSFPKDAPEGPILNGQHFTYDAASSSVTMSVLVDYSFSEDGGDSRILSANLYLKDLFGHHRTLTDKINGGQIKFNSGILGFYGDLEDRKDEVSFPRK